VPPLIDNVGDHRETASRIPYGLVFGAFAVSIAAATLFVASNATAAGASSGPTPAYLITGAESGNIYMLLINQETGEVTLCSTDFAGQCRAIGKITPDSSTSPLMVASVFILNPSTGAVAQCTAVQEGSCQSDIGIIPQSAGDSLEMLVTPAGGSVLVINKSSGGILNCNPLNSDIKPQGSCKSLRGRPICCVCWQRITTR
jgi:hypothetical protein